MCKEQARTVAGSTHRLSGRSRRAPTVPRRQTVCTQRLRHTGAERPNFDLNFTSTHRTLRGLAVVDLICCPMTLARAAPRRAGVPASVIPGPPLEAGWAPVASRAVSVLVPVRFEPSRTTDWGLSSEARGSLIAQLAPRARHEHAADSTRSQVADSRVHQPHVHVLVEMLHLEFG